MTEQAALWVEPTATPRRPTGRKRWGGRDSERARAHCRAMLPFPCPRCGIVITPDDAENTWHAGHIVDRMDGAGDRPDDTVPEHAHCNTSAGGKRGAALVNAQRAADELARERTVKWW